MTSGDKSKKTDLVNRFINEVHTFILNQAVRDTGSNELGPFSDKSPEYNQIVSKSTISGGNTADYGGMASGADLSASDMVSVFRAVAHGLTRIRKTDMFIRASGKGQVPTDFGVQLTALQDTHKMSTTAFNTAAGILGGEVPTENIVAGKVATDANLSSFITRLRDVVNDFINDGGTIMTITACHNSCHAPSCHGSRGRR